MYDLVVIGAGPGGVALAYEALLKGDKKILVLEKTGNLCQTLETFYKEGKRVDKVYKGCNAINEGNIPFEDGTKESTLELFKNLVEEKNIQIEYWCEVESIKNRGDFFEITTPNGNYQTKKFAVAIGRMGKPNKPDYKLPVTLKQIINFNANDVKDGEKILVVGGGNSAAEYAVDLSEKANVTMCYRRKEFIRLNEINLENVNKTVAAGKIKLYLGTDVVAVDDENSKVKITFTTGEIEIFDRVIYAIGGSTPVDFLQKCGIDVDENGIPTFDKNMETNVKGIFVVGDIASRNGASIIEALNQAKKVADYIF